MGDGCENREEDPGSFTGSSRVNRIVGLIGLCLFVAGLLVLRTDFSIKVVGTVEREEEFSVFAEESGVVREVFAEEGARLRKGQEVLRMGSRDLDFALLGKRRELVDLEFQLALSGLTLEEFATRPGSVEMMVSGERRELLRQISEIHADLIGRMEQLQVSQDIESTELQEKRIDRLRVELELLEAEVLARWVEADLPGMEKRKIELERERLERDVGLLRDEIEVLQARRESLRIRAPLPGILTQLPFPDPGSVVEKGDLLFRMADPDSSYRVVVQVPERNVDRIRPGTPVRMESEVFDSVLEGFIRGEVLSIAPDAVAGVAATGPSLFEVEIAVHETPRPLVLGSRVQVSILLGKRSVIELMLGLHPGRDGRATEGGR